MFSAMWKGRVPVRYLIQIKKGLCAPQITNHHTRVIKRNVYSGSSEEWVIASSDPDVKIPNISISQCLFDAQEVHAHKTSLINGETEETFTFLECREKILSLGSALTRLGVSKGDTVALIAPNCPEYVLGFLGAISIGATVTSVSPYFTAGEISNQLEDSGAIGVICHTDTLKAVHDAAKENKNIRHRIVIGKPYDEFISIQKLMKDDGKGMPNSIQIDTAEDVAILPYSSGTTGRPKGVMLTHYNIMANMHQMSSPKLVEQLLREGEQDVLISVLPFYHIYGMFMSVFLSMKVGLTCVTQKKFDTLPYLELIQKYKATNLTTVPPILSALCTNEAVTPEKVSSVNNFFCAAAPLGPALVEKVIQKFGTKTACIEGFGMTETSPATHVGRIENLVVGSCGSLVPNTSSKIIDIETGKSIQPGKGEGELCIKGPQVMKGYWNNLKATNETIKDGWLHTGDIARIDENHNTFIVDRLKELIKVNGLQVAPAELEDILRSHPSVKDVAVVGIPDERAGEVPRAFVVPSDDAAPPGEEVIEFVASKVAPYKRLAGGLFLVDEVPKNASGKILRRVLRNKVV